MFPACGGTVVRRSPVSLDILIQPTWYASLSLCSQHPSTIYQTTRQCVRLLLPHPEQPMILHFRPDFIAAPRPLIFTTGGSATQKSNSTAIMICSRSANMECFELRSGDEADTKSTNRAFLPSAASDRALQGQSNTLDSSLHFIANSSPSSPLQHIDPPQGFHHASTGA